MNDKLETLFRALDQDRIALDLQLRKLDNSLLNQAPGPAKWSALQTLRHLIMAEESSLVYMRKKLLDPSRSGQSTFSTKFRAALLLGWFKLGMKAKAPPAFAIIDPNQDRDTVLADYARVRRELADILDQVPDALVDRELFRHPLAGRMDLASALTFFRAHFHHHHKQIVEMLSLR
ncbi:MAG: DUF664 domain-containing protein [Bacteroidetes bacterium]|nr:DUF664 domain-containing protein [Bacteroidota bacterium]